MPETQRKQEINLEENSAGDDQYEGREEIKKKIAHETTKRKEEVKYKRA